MMLVTIRHVLEYGGEDDPTTSTQEWSIEVDAAYSPDIADDLATRVIALRDGDRRAEAERSA